MHCWYRVLNSNLRKNSKMIINNTIRGITFKSSLVLTSVCVSDIFPAFSKSTREVRELISKYKFIICALRNYNFISREKFKPGPGFKPRIKTFHPQWRENLYLHLLVGERGLYRSPNIVRVIKSRRLRYADHIARIEKGRSALKILKVTLQERDF